MDYLIESADGLAPVEIKSGETIRESMFDGLVYWSRLAGNQEERGFLVYGGKEDQRRSLGRVLGWTRLAELLQP